MLDAKMEVDQLRQRLRLKNLSEQVINAICDEVSREIGGQAVDILASATEEAVSAGSSVGSVEFINDIGIVSNGHGFEISTMSGKKDFSEPPFPMLPKLLKNAKIAKDGSQYKVIPIRDKSTKTNSNPTAVTTEAAYKNINNARHAAKQERDAMKEKLNTSSSPSPTRGMDVFAAMQGVNGAGRVTTNVREKSTEPIIGFRTASSKQDMNVKWVQPKKDANMDSALYDINARMQDSLDSIILDTIRRYEDGY